MRFEEADKRAKVQGSDDSAGAPILQRVPCLRSAQDERLAGPVLEVVGIPAGFERPREWNVPSDVGLRPRGPPRSPNLNANLERWHRSVKEECLSRLILFGEASLRQVLSQYVDHFHGERNHQGKGNVILFPMPADRIGELAGQIQTRERLGGLLKFYYRRAA